MPREGSCLYKHGLKWVCWFCPVGVRDTGVQRRTRNGFEMERYYSSWARYTYSLGLLGMSIENQLAPLVSRRIRGVVGVYVWLGDLSVGESSCRPYNDITRFDLAQAQNLPPSLVAIFVALFLGSLQKAPNVQLQLGLLQDHTISTAPIEMRRHQSAAAAANQHGYQGPG